VIGGAAGLILIVAGAVLAAPGLIVVGVVVLIIWALRSLWSRFGLRAVTYERRLDAVRAAVGDEIGLELTVRNRKLLPVPWLQVEDQISDAATVADRQLEPSDAPGYRMLRTTWTLGWYERVTRRLRIVADRRGVYELRRPTLSVADIFSRESVSEERESRVRYRIVPRSVPVRAHAPLSRMPGAARVQRGLFEDPSLFAGVRPYQAGDSLRRVHWRATARLGKPVSRRYEPAQERELVIALDVQTLAGQYWIMHYDSELIEALTTAALSLARSLVTSGVACGLAANGWSEHMARWVYLAPSASSAQIDRIADELAGLSRWPSLPFAMVLDRLGRRVPPQTGIVALSGRDGADFTPVLARLAATGREASLLAMGDSARDAMARARAARVTGSVARLSPNWRLAVALDLVG
jgi:uncharacterized protein (DUF58 family)